MALQASPNDIHKHLFLPFFEQKTKQKILCFAQNQHRNSGVTCLTVFFGIVVSPSISHRNC